MSTYSPTPLRVLIVCQGDLRGASEKQALGFGGQLAADGHDVVLSLRGDPASAEGEAASQDGLTLAWRGYRLSRVDGAHQRLVASFRPTVVHAFNPREAVLVPARAFAARSRAPLFVHWEDDEWSIRRGPPSRPLVRRVGRRARRGLRFAHPPQGVFITPHGLRWMARHAAGFDALTPALASHVSARLERAVNVVLPIMPAADWGAAPMANEHLPAVLRERPIVLYTGEIHPGSVEDLQIGLRGIAELQSEGHSLAVAHAGGSLPRYDLARLARDAGLQKGTAVSLGYIPFPQLPALLRRAAVLVQPGSPSEFNRLRLPSKMQGYLAAGVPTVTFAAGLGDLLQDGEEVMMTRTADPREFAGCVRAVLTDADLRERLSRGGPRAAARLFDSARNARALADHFAAGLEL